MCAAVGGAPAGEPIGEPVGQPISVVEVTAPRVANLQPASTFASPVTALRYDPRVDIQPRGLPEGQADVAVRGGLFENTAVNVGPVTLLDPQTGHYTAEIPLDPAMLSTPRIETGIENALAGFNASVATVRYEPAPLRDGGELAVGAGSDDLRVLELRAGRDVLLSRGGSVGFAASYAASRSDGSRPNGDHEFDRFAARVQHRGEGRRTDVLYGYQDKFFGWPGAYTGFANLAETDRTRTHLLLASHRRERHDGWWQVGGYFRSLDDDYDFDRTTRESGVPGAFEHETRSYGLGLEGLVSGGAVDWRVAAQLAGDELVASTDLTGGDFDSRRYARLVVVPEKTWSLPRGAALTVRAGLGAAYSDRDSDAVLPVAGMTWSRPSGRAVDRVTLEYAATSQLPGYTALKSPPAGLFGGNPHLGRERADAVALSVERNAPAWHGRATVFYRDHQDLVDWTFRQDAPFARQANEMDVEVTGVELELARQWDAVELVAGYTYLHKDEDYGAAAVDASFYALNYPEQRLTVALRFQPVSWLDVRLDNELSRHRENPLRQSDDEAYQAALAMGWLTPVSGLRVDLRADNLTDSPFQHFPGTPPPRRQLSLNARYLW